MNPEQKKPARTLERFIETLAPGDPIGHANLTLVPLRGEGHGRLDYLLAAEAIEAGMLEITEVGGAGSVPELLAINRSQDKILLLDGEELVGAKQNRILNTSVLLPEKSKTTIPVSCVEQGRWRDVSENFAAGAYSPARLRSRKSRDVSANLAVTGSARSDQGAVWEEVEQVMEDLRVESPTAAMHDAVRTRGESLTAYVYALPVPAGARGVIAVVNGDFSALDLFDRPETLARVWKRLLAGYALDAVARPEAASAGFPTKRAQALLEQLGRIPCRAFPSPGLGEDWRFDVGDVLGEALVVGGTCLHLSAFPGDGARERSSAPRIQPPSARRRRTRRRTRPGRREGDRH